MTTIRNSIHEIKLRNKRKISSYTKQQSIIKIESLSRLKD